MKYELMVRARPRGKILSKHERFIAALAKLRDGWGLKSQKRPQPPKPNTSDLEYVSLRGCLEPGRSGGIQYSCRKSAADAALYDDYYSMRFNPDKVDLESLIHHAFFTYVKSFAAYRAVLFDEEFTYLDFGKSHSIDYRQGVYRFGLANFFDRELCQRSFHSTPEQIAKRLRGKVQQVQLKFDGVFIITATQPIPLAVANSLNDELKQILLRKPARRS